MCHFLNLHHLYENDKLLVCSISNEKIASLLQLKDLTRVSKQLTKLEKYGVVKRIRTGRQNIYVLGEWYDYSEGKDGSKRLEWSDFSARRIWLALVWVSARIPMKAHIIQALGNLH